MTISSRPGTETATTAEGAVRGIRKGPVTAFQGIPYAAPPVGALRFAPPEPHPGWSGIRPATHSGPGVPQHPSALAWLTGQATPEGSEEGCLNLNIWSPAAAVRGAGPRPVLVWFHGGAFTSGSGGGADVDGARLAALGDIVVVTANFRMGPLGYLHLPEIGADNLGLLDQTAVLRWVRTNIAAFSGDPNLITVGGQSSGAYSALLLALSPDAGPLLRRVIAQSAPLNLPPQDPAQAAETAASYLRVLGVSGNTTAQQAAALRALPVGQLLDGYRELRNEALRAGRTAPPMYPVLGGAGLPRPLLGAAADGGLRGIDVLAGTTADEMAAFFARDERIRAADREGAIRMLTAWVGGRDRAEEIYGRSEERHPGSTPARILTDAASDLNFRTGVREIAGRRAEHGEPTYVYRFDRRPPGDDGTIGAAHCAELPFLFGNLEAFRGSPLLGDLGGPGDPRGVRAEALARTFGGALAAFVASGSPNGEGLAAWHPYAEGAADGASVRVFEEDAGSG
ncbi:carboxylesterase/lipase family protein [Streptomyces chattanoogensis]|uniref:carboxylesterase/lipase family protein n=1 Tax=Streptomyces chattanoogensis TaxID=66876 RepID=UPI0036C2B464